MHGAPLHILIQEAGVLSVCNLPGGFRWAHAPFFEKPEAATMAALVISKDAVSSSIKTIFYVVSCVIFSLSEHTARIISLGQNMIIKGSISFPHYLLILGIL